MRSSLPATGLALALLLVCAATGARAQDEPPEPEVKVDAATEREARVDRIRRIEKALATDREKLVESREKVAEWQKQFDAASTTQEELKQSIEGEGAAGLTAEERERLEGELDLVRKQTGYLLSAIETTQSQITALEEKIQSDQEGLDRLTGKADPPPTPEPIAPPASEPTPAKSPIPTLPGIPGGGAAETPTPAEATKGLPETPEQMAARRQALKREEEARTAEQAVVDFVERKGALEEQIELEQQQLENARESRATALALVKSRQQELDDLLESEAPKEELRKARAQIESDEEALESIDEVVAGHVTEVKALHGRLQGALADQLVIVNEAERRRKEAETARQRSIWLESPLHPQNILRWAMVRGPRILAVLIATALAVLLIRVSARQLSRVLAPPSRRRRRGGNRAETLAFSFRGAASGVIIIIGFLLVLEEGGLNVGTVLGGAAILGVAIAFGAQNLMRDYFNGLIILIEDQYELNDLLTIGAITGRVERLNMRTTVLRDLEGKVHFIPNGEIKAVTNHTYEWARAVFEIQITPREDVDRVISTLVTLCEEFSKEPEWKPTILEDPVMLGVDRFSEMGPVIKFMIKTEPDGRIRVKREMMRRIKKRFDELSIEMPVLQRIMTKPPEA